VVDDNVPTPSEIAGFAQALRKSLDDDLNMPVALAELADFLKGVNELCDQAVRKRGRAPRSAVEHAEAGFRAVEAELGLGARDASQVLLLMRDRRARQRGLDAAAIEQQIARRTESRRLKDFAVADRIRDELAAQGVELLDGPEGTGWAISD
jgi:cysteinyl-tRNA synthetase